MGGGQSSQSPWRGPGAIDPVAAVVAAARRAVAEVDDPTAEPMREEDASLVDVLEEASRRAGELFVVFDQFEEYFVYHEENDEFPLALAEAVRRKDRVRGSFLIALREDALAKLDRLQYHMPGLYDGLVRVDHLSSSDARDAIVGPLEEYNRRNAGLDAPLVAIEPNLVAEVVAQVEGDRGGGGLAADASRIEAPILQLVMTRLWNDAVETGSSMLKLDTFRKLGGAARIATAHVDDALAKLEPREQSIAATVFSFLVTRSGTKIAHSTADLADYAAIREDEVAVVLEKLAAERIVRAVQPEPGGSGVTRYEIFHDILASSILDWRTRHAEQQLLREERESVQAELARTSRERQLEKRLRLALASLALLAFVVVVLVAVVAAR